MTRWPYFGALALAMLATGACEHDHDETAHDHSDAHPKGHDHHAEGHGHGAAAVTTLTLWSESYEIFAEHTVVEAGEPLHFLVHVTQLADFAPFEGGHIGLELDGPATLAVESDAPLRPGIFSLTLATDQAGDYSGRISVRPGDGPPDFLDGFAITVFPKGSKPVVTGGHDPGAIEFLKEQQWRVPFATAFATMGSVGETLEVSALIRSPPGGFAEVGAPITGQVSAPPGGFPWPGKAVRKGQVLAYLNPAPASPEGAVRARLDLVAAEARESAARIALERAEKLIADGAISTRQLEDARRENEVAAEALKTARRATQLFAGSTTGSTTARWQVLSPIDGVVDAIFATAGATAQPGDTLFRVIDPGELWIAARLPEGDASRLRSDGDAAFRIPGLDTAYPLRLTGDDANATLVNVSRTVERRSRTVEVLYALRQPPDTARVGALVQAYVPVGEVVRAVSVPTSALVNRDGRDVVYVQIDGEHFAERGVRLGPRGAASVAISSGLSAGERIVTKGAHLIRLAEASVGGAAHGHIH